MPASARVDWFRFRPVVSDLVPVCDSPCRLIALSSCRLIITPTLHLVVSQTSQSASQALASLIPLSAPRPPIHPINPPIDPLTSLAHPPSILKIT